MGKFSSTRVAVIGMGHIGTYMRVCYEPLVEGNLKGQVVLIKATECHADEIRKEFGCPLVVGDTLGALREHQPDVILVCPPPSQIPPVIEESLVPYARERKENGLAKPDIYSFGPTPSVDFFYEKLGDTANVVKVLPNMYYETKGMYSAFLEVNFITFSESHVWPEDSKARLYEFLKPLVNVYEVSEQVSVPYLGVRNAAHCLFDMCFVMSDVMNAHAIPGEHHNEIASVMRAALRQEWQDMPKELIPCSYHALEKRIADFAAESIISWILGMGDFCREDCLPADAIDVVRKYRVEAYLVNVALYNREELNTLTKKHATKGGVCEKSGLFFNEFCRDNMTKAFSDYLNGEVLPDGWWSYWRKMGHDAALTVARHGMRLSDKK